MYTQLKQYYEYSFPKRDPKYDCLFTQIIHSALALFRLASLSFEADAFLAEFTSLCLVTVSALLALPSYLCLCTVLYMALST